MALVGKLETEVEIKSSADKFFNTYRAKAHLVHKSSEDNVHGAEMHEGDFESSQAIKEWTYNLDGKSQKVKGRIEVDEENNKVTSTILEGEVLTRFKSFIVCFQAIPKGEGSLVKWTWEYEKVSEDIPDPKKFQDLAVNLTHDVDAHILSELAA